MNDKHGARLHSHITAATPRRKHNEFAFHRRLETKIHIAPVRTRNAFLF